MFEFDETDLELGLKLCLDYVMEGQPYCNQKNCPFYHKGCQEALFKRMLQYYEEAA